MLSYFFILSAYAGGGIEKVFENITGIISRNFLDSSIFLYVVNGFDEKNYSAASCVTIIKSKKELKKITKTKDKIVINFSGDWKSGLAAWKISKEYISWVHQNPFTMKTARTSSINFHLLKKSQRIVCVCKEQKEILQDNFKFKNRIDVIYNSVDFEKAQILSAIPLESIDFNYILMVARIDFKSKDFFTVIDSYCRLSKDFQNRYRLVFLGDGPDRQKVVDYINQTVPADLRNSILLPGFDKNPYRWMKNASVSILSSKTEGLGVSAIEAMSLRCPVLVTDYRTGSKEISDGGKCAVLVKIGNADEMENAVEKILADEMYRKSLVENASVFVQQFYQKKIERNLCDFFLEYEAGCDSK